jgi:hypothetical protein
MLPKLNTGLKDHEKRYRYDREKERKVQSTIINVLFTKIFLDSVIWIS